MRPCCGRYTPLITLSIELLPAPFGPMIARISCSRTSKLTSVSAFTPPNASDTPSTARMTSPSLRPAASATLASCRSMSGRLSQRLGGEGARVLDPEIGADIAGAAILEAHLRLDDAALDSGIERIDDGGVFLRDEATPHLARAGELAVVGVQLLVQDHESVDLAAAELGIAREVRVHLLHALAHQLAHLRLRGEVGVARIRDAAALGPVAHGLHVDVDHRGGFVALVAERDGFLDVREELELVLEV